MGQDPKPAPGRRKRRRRPRRQPDTPLAAARRTARLRLGISRLRPAQERALEAVLAGRDTVAVLPTGYGKSLIYQVPALLFDRPTLVLSPLLALMRDQEKGLEARGIPVVRLDSTVRPKARREALARIEQGGSLIVLTTPETLETDDAGAAVGRGRPKLLCVDEAHCISEWGHDFRPAYLRIGAERRTLKIPQVLALTATATPRVRTDIAGRLRLNDPVEVLAPPHRPNLRLSAHYAPGNEKITRAGRILRTLQRPGIVYCATTRAVDEIYTALRRARIPCARYHGKMRKADREAEQKRFMHKGRRTVMVATSAFGMGIDKPDIRYIMHYQVPASPEQYVQEAGRAGRDGRASECILLFDPADLAIQEYLQTRSRPNAAQLRRVARALQAWAAESKPVTTKDLALSAGVPLTTCRSMCAQLEEGGLIELDSKRRWTATVELDALQRSAKSLAGRFEIERRQDEGRLRAMTEYLETDECRSAFLRRWFGEDDPPACGNCDLCGPKRPRRPDRPPRGPQRGRARRRRAGGRPPGKGKR
ncbi:MAG: RecQ family ATP-dependent DNA helicase [Planctomycetota bacterium]|jgi:ATP-dependent DNA helicase RecQ